MKKEVQDNEKGGEERVEDQSCCWDLNTHIKL